MVLAPSPWRPVLVFCAFLASLALSLDRAAAEDPGRLTYYSLGVAEGLSNDSVYCVYQDRAGFMWFGTFGGLLRYDGESLATYRPREGSGSLQASVVFALAEDGRGDLWVGTDGGGLARYNREADSFMVLRANPGNPSALSSDRILALGCDRRGRLWVGTADGLLSVLDPATGRFTRISPPGKGQRYPVRCIAVDHEGFVWAGTEGGGLVRIDPSGEASVFLHNPVDPESLGSDTVRSLLVDGAGRLVAGLGDGGVDLMSGSRFLHARPADGARLPEEAVRALVEDPEGEVWVGWADSGLGVFDSATLALRPPKAGQEAMIRSLYRDSGGLVWAGIKGGGTRTYNVASGHFQRFASLGSGEALRQARGMAELPDGRVLVGSDGQGLLVLDPATGRAEAYPGMPRDRAALKVYSVIVAKDTSVWAGTDGGGLIRRLQDGRVVRYRHKAKDAATLSSDVVWSLLEEADGRVLVGTEGGGLDRLDPATGRFEHFRHEAGRPGTLQGSSIRSLYRDRQGRLWISSWDGGLSRLDPGSSNFINYLPDGAAGASLPDASVNCVLEDLAGNLWIGTGGSGLACLDGVTGAFMRYDVNSGLAGSTVYGLLSDGHGLLWIATATGLSSLDPESGTFFSYGTEDGLAPGGLSQNASLAARDGSLWVGGPSGVTRFFPAEAARSMPQPRVAITTVFGSDGKALGRSSDGRRLVLPAGNAGLSFRIAVLDYSAPSRNRYAMKLEGRQAGWTELGYSNSGTLAQLAPGDYLLRVKGANGNGVWNEEGDSLGITVEPPFYGTLWFRLAAIGFALFLTTLAIALRTRSLRTRNELLVKFARHVEEVREEERTNAAREVHDEIGQHLAVANLQSYWLKNHPEAGLPDRVSRLETLQTSIFEAMGAVKSVATRLRPIALDALSFGETASWYARDFERRTGIACKVTLGRDVPPLTDAEATALFRVLQEALANVARHAGARNVVIDFLSDEAWVTLRVADDGRGMEAGKAQASDAFGIIGMRERCAAFGGSLEVRSSPGQGAEILARVPSKERD